MSPPQACQSGSYRASPNEPRHTGGERGLHAPYAVPAGDRRKSTIRASGVQAVGSLSWREQLRVLFGKPFYQEHNALLAFLETR